MRYRGALRAGTLACCLTLAGCGFHFPTSFNRLPPELASVHVVVAGSTLRDPPLLKAAVRQVRAAGGRVVPGPGAPLLTLSNEYFVPQVLVVDPTGRVAAYLLSYALSFELQDAAGRVLIPSRTVKLQREYTFSRFNVLGESRQQRHLKHEMRAEAIRKILFQLAAFRPKPAGAQ
ncbi:MAG: LPS-assembly lipoprotein LptE [Acidiferrobacteraceae bacterium]